MPIRCPVLESYENREVVLHYNWSKAIYPGGVASPVSRYPHREYELKEVLGGQLAGRAASGHRGKWDPLVLSSRSANIAALAQAPGFSASNV